MWTMQETPVSIEYAQGAPVSIEYASAYCGYCDQDTTCIETDEAGWLCLICGRECKNVVVS